MNKSWVIVASVALASGCGGGKLRTTSSAPPSGTAIVESSSSVATVTSVRAISPAFGLVHLGEDRSWIAPAGHTKQVTDLRFSPDGRTLSSLANDEWHLRWDLTGRQVGAAKIGPYFLSPDFLRFVGDDLVETWTLGYAAFFDARTGAPCGELDKMSISNEVFSRDGRFLVGVASSVQRDGCCVFEFPSMKLVRDNARFEPVIARAISPDDELLVSLGWDGGAPMIFVERVRTGEIVSRVTRRADEKTLASWERCSFSNGGRVVAISTDTTVALLDPRTGTIGRPMDGERNLKRVAFSPDDQMLALVSEGAQAPIRIRNAASGAVLRELRGHTSQVRSIAFSPDGKLLASGDDSGRIILWDLATGSRLATF
jgi:WD40 repeat protein